MNKLFLNCQNLDDIKYLQSICGRSLPQCRDALKETNGNIVESIQELVKYGIPCIGFAKKEDEINFLKNYPNMFEILSRLTKKAVKVCEDVYYETGNKIYNTIVKLIPESELAKEIMVNNFVKVDKSHYRFWDIVEGIGWEELINEGLKDALQKGRKKLNNLIEDTEYNDFRFELQTQVRARVNVLKDALDEHALNQVGNRNSYYGISDDSFHYLCTHIVGCGKDAYFEVINNPEVVFSKYLVDNKYHEGFEYVFHV